MRKLFTTFALVVLVITLFIADKGIAQAATLHRMNNQTPSKPATFDRTCLQASEFDTGWSRAGMISRLNGISFSTYNSCQADAVTANWGVRYSATCPATYTINGNGVVTEGIDHHIYSGVLMPLYNGSLYFYCSNGDIITPVDKIVVFFQISGSLSSGQTTYDSVLSWGP